MKDIVLYITEKINNTNNNTPTESLNQIKNIFDSYDYIESDHITKYNNDDKYYYHIKLYDNENYKITFCFGNTKNYGEIEMYKDVNNEPRILLTIISYDNNTEDVEFDKPYSADVLGDIDRFLSVALNADDKYIIKGNYEYKKL